MYYGAIVIDLMLRCTWSFKLSPHLDHFNDLEGGIFVMEFLEVLRRWTWIFFRVETEWGKDGLLGHPFERNRLMICLKVRTNKASLPTDILLGDVDRNDDIDSPLSPSLAFPK